MHKHTTHTHTHILAHASQMIFSFFFYYYYYCLRCELESNPLPSRGIIKKPTNIPSEQYNKSNNKMIYLIFFLHLGVCSFRTPSSNCPHSLCSSRLFVCSCVWLIDFLLVDFSVHTKRYAKKYWFCCCKGGNVSLCGIPPPIHRCFLFCFFTHIRLSVRVPVCICLCSCFAL